MLTWFQIGLLVEQSLDINGPDYISFQAYDALMWCTPWNFREYNKGAEAALDYEYDILEEEDGTD